MALQAKKVQSFILLNNDCAHGEAFSASSLIRNTVISLPLQHNILAVNLLCPLHLIDFGLHLILTTPKPDPKPTSFKSATRVKAAY